MAGKKILRSITLSLVLAGSATAAQAENLVRDKNGGLVGAIQGWKDWKPIIVVNHANRVVPLRVAERHFETVDVAKFTTDNCTGTVYVDDFAPEQGLNAMQSGIVYVMGSRKHLYRTRASNAPQMIEQDSLWQQGKCLPAAGMVSVIEADVFVRNLFGSYKPPFKVVQ